jgi:polysaccharide deacetylase family protein (PEP-CTERM system associated)
MDVEDWYHLDYFDRSACDASRSLLDGVEVYAQLLESRGLRSTFFVLGELAECLAPLLRKLAASGHDMASHGWNHVRPLCLSLPECREDLLRSKKTLEDVLGRPISGYRAPCFSLDRSRLELAREVGYLYDSSRILFAVHPLYGRLDMKGFAQLSPNVYRQGGFFEFQVSTQRVLGKNIPVSGGGYIRILPWVLMRRLISRYAVANELYVLYIHPFELSPQPAPPCPPGTKWSTKLRYRLGRASVASRLSCLLELLQKNGFEFTTFAALRQKLLAQDGPPVRP